MFITKEKIAMRIACFLGLVLTALSCSEDIAVVEEQKPNPVSLTIPANFPQPVYDLSVNSLTEEGIALGKMLFYGYS